MRLLLLPFTLVSDLAAMARIMDARTIVMMSDGLSASWNIADYFGLLRKGPQLIAGIMLRDYRPDSDDATVLVAR